MSNWQDDIAALGRALCHSCDGIVTSRALRQAGVSVGLLRAWPIPRCGAGRRTYWLAGDIEALLEGWDA